MSDTPRTNDQIGYDGSTMSAIRIEFCRQLERELNAANSKIELLMSANADVARIAGERDAAEKRIRLLIAERDTARLQTDQKHSLREEFRELLGTDDIEVGVAVVREMKNRIKRLEDRIDRASKAFFSDCPDEDALSKMLAILEEERNKQ